MNLEGVNIMLFVIKINFMGIYVALISESVLLPFLLLFLAREAKIPRMHSTEKIINPVRIPDINPG